jgi:HK97 family phage prohead protease
MKNITNKVLRLSTDKLVVKEVDGGLSIEGYANTTNKDRANDIILEEAWTKGGLDNYLKNPIILAFHDHTRPIGQVVDYGVNNKGFHVVAEISKAAGDVYSLIREGILKAFSVGFRVKDADYDAKADIFIIKDLELLELSVVSVPANADTIFSVRKSFEKEEDYLNFKNTYIKAVPVEEKTPVIQEEPIKEKKIVDKENISLTPEELEAAKQKAVKEALAAIDAEKARKEEIAAIAKDAGSTGAERLVAELTKRFDDDTKSLQEKLAGMEEAIKEKASEMEALYKNKMSFENPKGGIAKISDKDIDKAVLSSIITGKPLQQTKAFKDIVEKAGDHLGGVTGADWENLFSLRMYEEIMDKTVIEPLFSNRISMTSRTMTFPWNPEAGYAEWIDGGVGTSQYKSGTGFGDGGESTGTAVTHTFNENVITAQKLATKEFIGYEEEEDAILPLLPMIRDAVIRRMVRSTDTELLRGIVGTSTGSCLGLINGVSTIATNNTAQYQPTGTFGDAISIADLQSTRRVLGRYGLVPGELIYVVSESVMYDLMEDPDFRTMDLVGANATILRGQIGMVNGSPVIVSDSFVANSNSTVQAIALNARNYMLGELRGLTVERDRDIINQKNVIVATRRFGFTEIVPGATSGQHACAALIVQA